MTPDALIAKLRAARESTVELEAGKAVRIRRPLEVEFADFGRGGLPPVELVCRHVVGWDGITEADLIGAAGSNDAAPFSPALWSEVARDRSAWVLVVYQALIDAINAHAQALEADAKN